MTKNTKKLTVLVLLFTLALSAVTYARSYSRNITAWFNNIQVMLDGKALNLSSEPFIFENRVYMPIEELSDTLYMNYNYDDKEGIVTIDSNRLEVTDPDSSAAPVAFQKEYELNLMKYQNDLLQKELALLRDGNYPYQKINTVNEMQKYLQEHFGKLQDIDMTIQLYSTSKNKYMLNAVFNYNDLNKWNILGRRTIENWVDDLFYAIKDLFNTQAEIEGSIRHSSVYNNTKLTSYYTKGGRLYYQFSQASQKKNQLIDGEALEKALTKSLKNYSSSSFSYEVFVSQNDVDLIITTQSGFFNWTPSLKMQYLKRLRSEINKFNPHIYINGRIKDASKTFRFSIEGETIRSVDLMDETEAYLNSKHKTLYYLENFNFTYTISEGYANSFKIDLEGDFANNNTNWVRLKNNSESTFRYFVQNAYRYVEGIWGVDIFGEVMDKDLNTICDLEFYPASGSSTRSLQPITFR